MIFPPFGTSPGKTARSLLFAAGRGERLRPLTERLAKPALPLLDIPLGAWGVEALSALRPTVVNASHLFRSVVDALGSRGDGVRFFVEEPEPFGTGGTLAALSAEFADTFVCWNADMLTDLDAQELVETHERLGGPATIAVRGTTSHADFRVEGNRVVQLIDRRTESRAGHQYLGAAVFEKEVPSLLPEDRPLGLTYGLLKPLLEREELGVHVHDGYWIDVGTFDRYLRATLDVLLERGPQPPRPIPGEIVQVEGGRAYVGPGASIERGSLGPGAIVLAGASVGRGARLEHSIVWQNEEVPAHAHHKDGVWFSGRHHRTDL